MAFHSTNGSEQQSQGTPNPVNNPDGSFEVAFSADRSTDYSDNGYNAHGFSANGTHKPESPSDPSSEKPPKRNIPLFILAALALLTVFSVLMSVGTFLTYRQDSLHHTLGTKPPRFETVDPWVNPFETAPTDAYAAATAKTVNSVVVITTDGGSGSGVIWACGDTYSYIVTCHHVIDGEKEITITFHNDETAIAKVVGSDARTDIAVLAVERTDLSPIILPNENSTMTLGQAVIAIGNPLGVLGNSVSDGILSSLTRSVSIGGTTMKLLQTTAAVNHGNSGGGLFDLNGQLIGLVNAKISETSVEGIGFAIPYDTIRTVAGELIEKGYVSGRPTLGIKTVMIDSTEAYTNAIAQYPDLESYVLYRDIFGQTRINPGLYVVDPSGAGYGENASGLAFGDRITDIGSQSITSASDLQSALNGYDAGDTAQITYARQNKKYITEIILGSIGQ